MHQALPNPLYDFGPDLTGRSLVEADRIQKLHDLRGMLAAVLSSKRGSLGGYGKAQLRAMDRLKRKIGELERGHVGKGHALTAEGQAKLTALVGDISKPHIERRMARRILRRDDMTFTEEEGLRMGLLLSNAA
jgi:hypothetical protein